MPVRHCVMGKFTAEATDEQKKTMVAEIVGMKAKIDVIVNAVAGLDLGIDPSANGFVATLYFGSKDDYVTYSTHPEHVAVITNFIKPILAPGTRNAVQFEY